MEKVWLVLLAAVLSGCGKQGEPAGEYTVRVELGECIVYKSLVKGTHVWASPNCHVAGR